MPRSRVIPVDVRVVTTGGMPHGLPHETSAPANAHLGPLPNSIHEDGYASDTSPRPGLLGTDALVADVFEPGNLFGGICSTFVYTSDGHLVTMSFSYKGIRLLLMDAESLVVFDELELPARKRPPLRKLLSPPERDKLFRDVSGGAYFFLDDLDRVVIGAADGALWIVETRDEAKTPRFTVHAKIAIRGADTKGKIVGVMPDHTSDPSAKRRYWFATVKGVVGLVELGERKKSSEKGARFEYATREWTLVLAESGHEGHDPISNSFAVNENGAFLVTCTTLYRFVASDAGIAVADRYVYEPNHGSHQIVPGRFSLGSGTTPTLLGRRAVAIGDGSVPMNVIVCDQKNLSNAARVAVMGPQSACELSFVGHGDHIVAVNTYGYTNPFSWTGWKAPGTAKVTITSYDPMTLAPSAAWQANAGGVDTGSSTPRLSLSEGVFYAYAMSHEPYESVAWRLFGLDWGTGKRVLDIEVFRSEWAKRDHDNAWGVVTLGPRNTLLVGMWRGFLRIRPRRPGESR